MKVVPKPVAAGLVESFVELYVKLRDASGDQILPRQAMTMRDAAPYAADMTIVEIVSDDEWIIRLNGTGHCQSASVDRTGQNVLESCSPEEREVRRGAAEQMFGLPCGIFAILIQTYDDGSTATLHTTSLPLLGKGGERMILTYGPLVEDIEDPHRAERPVLSDISVKAHRFVNLGFGVPA